MTAKFIWLCSLQVKMMYCKLWQSFLVFHWTAAPWGCSDLQLYERPVRILFPQEHPPLLFRAELNIPHLIYWSFVYHLCSISLWSRNSTVTVSACIRLKQLRLFCKSFGSLWCFLCLLIRWLWCSRTQNFCPRQASEFYVSSGYMITCIPSETHWNNEKIWHFGSQKSLFVWKFGALFCWTVSPKDSLKILLSLWIPSLELLLTICLWIYSELFLHGTWGSLGGKNTRTGSLEKVKFTSLSVLWVSLRCFDPFCSQLHTPPPLSPVLGAQRSAAAMPCSSLSCWECSPAAGAGEVAAVWTLSQVCSTAVTVWLLPLTPAWLHSLDLISQTPQKAITWEWQLHVDKYKQCTQNPCQCTGYLFQVTFLLHEYSILFCIYSIEYSILYTYIASYEVVFVVLMDL